MDPRPGRLGHEDPDQLLLGIDPEVRPGGAAPRHLAGPSRYRGEAVLAADGESPTEGVGLYGEDRLAGRGACLQSVAEAIGVRPHVGRSSSHPAPGPRVPAYERRG